MNYKEIGRRIRYERESLGLTRDKFAEALELSTNFVGQLERGEKKMSLETLVTISDCLRISLDYLIKGNTENQLPLNRLHKLIDRCSQDEILLLTDMTRTILPHYRKLK